MNQKKNLALLKSILALICCVSMLAGTTFAWFTDSVTSSRNMIATGTLDVELYHSNSAVSNEKVNEQTQLFLDLQGKPILWEPGVVSYENLRIVNEGSLALVYQLALNVAGENYIIDGGNQYGLSQVLKVGVVENGITATTREGVIAAVSSWTKLENLMRDGSLLADGEKTWGIVIYWQPTASDNNWNANNGKQLSSGDALSIDLGIHLTATQMSYEKDSFGNDYDVSAKDDIFPSFGGGSASAPVSVDANGLTTAEVSIAIGDITAIVPAGVKVKDGVSALTLSIQTLNTTSANVVLGENEALRSMDVHVEGVAADNTAPITVILPEVAPVALNLGNYKLYHVENGATNEMTLVASNADFSAHNQFKYDPATGDIALYMASFSEVAVVAETDAGWKGEFATGFAGGSGTEDDPYIIANADQLAYFGAVVGGMNGQTKNSFDDKYIKLIADINLADADSTDELRNNSVSKIFYPIGYYYNGDSSAPYSTVYSFEGTFDGNGHTIANFYQNTWEIKGDYDGNYYKDAMGLFGYVVNGTIKNLTVDHFSSDGEFTPTGVIAAYAVNSTFENIAITNCNPRVYNTGNGGIVGIGGNSDDPDTYELTFTNITIDNSNKITALWGSWDVACGGLVGMFRGAGHAYMTNCHVAAQIDVYNDVCGNYQYYWYRYSGMMIGTNKNMITDDDGYTVPETSKFHAENCTVHFGDWNDYYYCELVANTLASYTHDHQFSRLTVISSLDEIKSGDTWTKTGNFLLISGDTKTCYHIVNKDGVLTQHLHTDAGTETVGGETVLKEDKQIVYLPFNQLFTGYGWGVKHIPVYNGENYAFDGITILDREVADSVEKFEGKVNELANNKTYKLGDIFSFVDNGVKLIPGALTVTVTNKAENNPVSATIVYDSENWENGTITLTGTGEITITIQDYYFCTPTTITVNVTNRSEETKFESKFTGDFLYRVGNQNTVTWGTLFKAVDGISIGSNVKMSIAPIAGSANATFTEKTNWTDSTALFNGTGVVKVTITDNDYCTPTDLLLEVVDATNLTNATGTIAGGTFVLLCDVNTSTYVNYWNSTLYGNGFTYSLKGAPTAYNSKQGKGIIITKNTVLDNVRIIGDVYTGYGAFTNNDYYNTAIDVQGDTTIQNCYIANCSAPVRARNNVTIINSTLYGGAVANLIIESDKTTLENVITANYDDGRALIGMGIVIHSDATDSAELVLKGDLKQYNFISEDNKPSDSYAQNLYTAMFGNNCTVYHFGESPNRYVNTGIISLASNFTADDITGTVAGYQGKSLTIQGNNGYVYTQLNTSGTVDNNCPEYKPTTQGAVPPSYSFDYTNKNYIAKTDGSNDYCYEENGKVNISMDEGDTFNWDTSILTIGKGITNYTVSMNGADYTGKSIAFNTADDYTVTYTYTDNNNYKLDENGNITTYSVTYTKTVNITVAVVEATTKHAEFTFGSSNTASTTVTIGNNTYVMPNVGGTSSTIGSTTVDGNTIYYPIVEIIMSDGKTTHSSGWYAYFPVFSGAVTITDYADKGTGDKMTPYGGSTTAMPSGLSVVGDAKTLFKYQSGSNADASPSVKNSKLVYSSAKIEANRDEYNTVVQYKYTDNAGATYYYYIGYHAPSQKYSPSCITPDTLVTLADGSQVRVDSLKGDEQLLVWNHQTGKLDKAPVAYIVNHDAVVAEHEVYHLTFANGKTVKIIGEHVFFDATLNKYVALDSNAADYIGHEFLGLADNGVEKVKLVSVEKNVYETSAYEVVSYKHLTCFTNDMLSTSAYLDQLLNVFDINTDTFAYDMESVVRDIETYGLYTYADFEGLISEEAFELYDAQYLKIAIGKGYITWDDILALIDIYFNVEVQPLN